MTDTPRFAAYNLPCTMSRTPAISSSRRTGPLGSTVNRTPSASADVAATITSRSPVDTGAVLTRIGVANEFAQPVFANGRLLVATVNSGLTAYEP